MHIHMCHTQEVRGPMPPQSLALKVGVVTYLITISLLVRHCWLLLYCLAIFVRRIYLVCDCWTCVFACTYFLGVWQGAWPQIKFFTHAACMLTVNYSPPLCNLLATRTHNTNVYTRHTTLKMHPSLYCHPHTCTHTHTQFYKGKLKQLGYSCGCNFAVVCSVVNLDAYHS